MKTTFNFLLPGKRFYSCSFFFCLILLSTHCYSQCTCPEDSVLPVIIPPPGGDLHLSCTQSTAERFNAINAWLNSVTATDNCDPNVSIIHNFPNHPDNCEQYGSEQVIFIAEDDCGNSVFFPAFIFFNHDNEPPVVTPPPVGDLQLLCTQSPQEKTAAIVSWLASATATDNCNGSLPVTHNIFSFFNDNCSVKAETVFFTATDNCGNQGSGSAGIFFIDVDETAPTIACANDTTVCSGAVNFPTPTYSDNCAGDIALTFSSQVTPGANGTQVHCRTWTATDGCGNAASCDQCITELPPINVDAGPNKIVYKGYPDSACTRLQSAISGGVAPLTRTWSTAGNSNLGSGTFIDVCPLTTRVYYLTVTDANGCTAKDSVRVCVIDVRCGTNNKSVIICHGTGSATNPFVTLCVGKTEGNSHFLNHPGEQLGTCGMVKSCNWPVETRLETSQMEESVEYLGAFPNPFTGSTTVQFMLPENDYVTVTITDVTGRQIEKLFDGKAEGANIYEAVFDGSKYSGGIYFLRMNTESGTNQTMKIILNK